MSQGTAWTLVKAKVNKMGTSSIWILLRKEFVLISTLLLILGKVEQGTASPIQNPSNGHYYDVVIPVGGTNWFDAEAAAESLNFLGAPGHLGVFCPTLQKGLFHDSVPHNPR